VKAAPMAPTRATVTTTVAVLIAVMVWPGQPGSALHARGGWRIDGPLIIGSLAREARRIRTRNVLVWGAAKGMGTERLTRD
jgi:hypothetical protein